MSANNSQKAGCAPELISSTLNSNYAITAIPNSAAGGPTALTITGNNFIVGEQIAISGVGGMTQLNGNTYVITSVSGATVDINVDSSAFGVYTSGGTATGYALLGTLLHNPVHLIFDNQSTSTCLVSADGGVTQWKTFPAGEALVLDMRGNKGIASNFTFSVGTQFSVQGALGTGKFSISYTYAVVT